MSLALLPLAALMLLYQATPVAGSDVSSLGLSASYDVSAVIGWSDRTVRVDTAVEVRGTVPWPTSTLAFNLSTFRTGRAEIGAVSVDGQPVEPLVDDQTVLVPLPQPLASGGAATVRIVSTARLNASPRADSDEWGFARTDGLLTAYRWIPWLSRTTPFDRPSVGDPFVTASAERVRVTIEVDHELIFATSGTEVARDGGAWTFEAANVRDFNLSASPDYRIAQRTVAGTPIKFFHRRLAPDAVLDVAGRALADFSARVGPYPYPELTIAEVGPWAPLESPAHFWLPDNAPARLLPWMTAHETAHQWFYAVVGNDQAREPFADEALTDLMARSLISRFVPSQCPPGDLDQSIYDLGECYPWVVYVQGVAYLRKYRDAVGGAAFWRGVADYFDAYRFGIGGTRELLAALDRAAGRTRAHEDRFPGLRPPIVGCLPLGRR